jgi:predicted HNH restriction endonuclease
MRLYCDRYICYFCGLIGQESTSCRNLIEIHHLVEQCNGGNNEPSNLIACCSTCHSRVHNNLIVLDKWYNVGFAMKMKWSHKGKEYFGRNTLPL